MPRIQLHKRDEIAETAQQIQTQQSRDAAREEAVKQQLDKLIALRAQLQKERELYEKRIASAQLQATELENEIETFLKEKGLEKLESTIGIALRQKKSRTEKVIDVKNFFNFLRRFKDKATNLVDYVNIPSGKLCKDFGEKVLIEHKVLSYHTTEKEVLEIRAKA